MNLSRPRATPAALAALALLASTPACGDDIEEEPMVFMEVHGLVMEVIATALRGEPEAERLARAKALAVQAKEVAGDNETLIGVAEMAAALAEASRGNPKAAERHLEASMEVLPAGEAATALALEKAQKAARSGKTSDARAQIDAWRTRTGGEEAPEVVRKRMDEAIEEVEALEQAEEERRSKAEEARRQAAENPPEPEPVGLIY